MLRRRGKPARKNRAGAKSASKLARLTAARTAVVICLLAAAGCAQNARAGLPLRRYAESGIFPVVPYPQTIRSRSGVYVWPAGSSPSDSARASIRTFRIPLRGLHRSGAYSLDVRPGGIRISAADAAGLFYGRETLAQITLRQGDRFATPAVRIEDAPRYAWRGIHLDVARRYFPLPTLEKFVVLAARYKLNVVHLHFTDDQAWRLPSVAYPRLPSVLHYTRAQLKALNVFAARHFVTIVPEVDLPAHSAAAIRAYPALACGSSSELCPSRASRFAGTIAHELVRMFPGSWIHFGGDEVQTWTATQRAQFEANVAAGAHALGRTPVLWDDEADVAPAQAAIMVWHLGRAEQRAARGSHRIVQAPDGPLYFNAAQGEPAQEPPASRYVSTLEQVYAYDAVGSFYGIEATMWTEKIATERALWYMLLPREIALAEVAWTQPQHKSWARFYRGLPAQLAWLDGHGYSARIPNVMFRVQNAGTRYASVTGRMNAASANVPNGTASIALDEAMPGAVLWYRRSARGSWQRYRGRFTVACGAEVDAYASAGGRSGAVSQLMTRCSGAAAGSTAFDGIVSP